MVGQRENRVKDGEKRRSDKAFDIRLIVKSGRERAGLADEGAFLPMVILL